MDRPFIVPAAIITAVGLLAGGVSFAQRAPDVTPKSTPTAVSWNATSVRNPDRSVTTSFKTNWVNYYDDGWKKIVTDPVSVDGGWEVALAPYTLQIPTFADSPVTFTSKTPFDPDTKSFHEEGSISKIKSFVGAGHVEGVIEDGNVVYTNAHPLGDILYRPEEDGFQAIVRINEVPKICDDPSESVRVPFTENYSDSLFPAGITSSERDIGKGWVTERSKRKIVTREADVWDSSGKRRAITVLGSKATNTLSAEKVIPCSFILSASLPVYTDTTTSVYSSAGDGYVSYGNASWATVRGAAAGDGKSTTDTSSVLGAFFIGGTTYASYNHFYYWDTSAIPDADSIESATFDISFPNTAAAQDHTHRVVRNRQASDTLALADFDAVGDSGPGTGDIYGTFTRTAAEAAGTESITLSAAGILQINPAGTTYFSIVDDAYWSNSIPTSKTDSGVGNNASMSETTGTASDPTLVIVHSSAAGSTRKNVILIILKDLVNSYIS